MSTKTSTKPKMKTAKKVMTEDQLLELESAEGTLSAYRDDVANQRSNVRTATQDAREAQANLKKEKNHLAKAEKDLAAAKKTFGKLKAKYKGWAKPKANADLGYPDAAIEESVQPGLP